jgi:GH43 family beta-xylosidase
VVFKEGVFYLVQSEGALFVRKSATLAGLKSAAKVRVWTNQCCNVWAPELQWINDRWYIYYARDDGQNASHRMYALESTGADALGPYVSRGKVFDATTDRWAIDGSVLQKPDGSLYFVWSGWPGGVDGRQNLYLAPMNNPWTISGPRVLISQPTQPWERQGLAINEVPQPLVRGGSIFIVFSASGAWTDEYCLGLLTCTSSDVLNPTAWVKTGPLFTKSAKAFGPGHNSMVQAPDGQWWNVHHAIGQSGGGFAGRAIRAQKFAWDRNEFPIFGAPLPLGSVVEEGPGAVGNGTGLRDEYFSDDRLATLAARRLDPTLDFDWGAAPPHPSLSADGSTVRWASQVQPLYSEIHTLRLAHTGPARVWFDGRRLIDAWNNLGPLTNTLTLTLEAGRRYDLRCEYLDRTDTAWISLWWSSASTPLGPIPPSQLFPPPEPPPRLGAQLQGQELILRWPASAAGFNLRATASLAPPIQWSGIAEPPVTADGWHTLRLPLADGNRFYQLVQP